MSVTWDTGMNASPQPSSQAAAASITAENAKERGEAIKAELYSLTEDFVLSVQEVEERVKNSFFSITVAGKTYKLDCRDDIPLEVGYRDALYSSVEEALRRIKEKVRNAVTAKIESAIIAIEQQYERLIKTEYDVKAKLQRANLMPEVSPTLASKGLSVSKDGGKLIWHYRTFYAPKFVDQHQIRPDFAAELVTPVILLITTEGDKILSITVNRFDTLTTFDHYHRSCWGKWKYSSYRYHSPEDILKVAKEAQAVLETINSGSPATSDPAGLPTLGAVKSKLILSKAREKVVIKNSRIADQESIRSGWDTLIPGQPGPQPISPQPDSPTFDEIRAASDDIITGILNEDEPIRTRIRRPRTRNSRIVSGV